MGLSSYRCALAVQEELVRARIAGKICDKVIILEHTPTITLGARGSANKLLADTEEIVAKGIEVVSTARGGGTTAHNPGQLVFYPIINLKDRRLGITEFVRGLEAIGIELLDTLGLRCQRQKGLPGLWIDGRKIASLGIKVKRWTTFHGMAININNDLGIFDYLVPCGLDDVVMTSVAKELGSAVSIAEAGSRLKKILLKKFKSTGICDNS